MSEIKNYHINFILPDVKLSLYSITNNILVQVKTFIDTLEYKKKQKLFILLCQYNNSTIKHIYRYIINMVLVNINSDIHSKFIKVVFPNMNKNNINLLNILELYNEKYIDSILLFMLICYYIDITYYNDDNTNMYLKIINMHIEPPIHNVDEIYNVDMFDCITVNKDINNIPYFQLYKRSKFLYPSFTIDATHTLYKIIYHVMYNVETEIIKQYNTELLNIINDINNSDSDSDSDSDNYSYTFIAITE